MFVKVVVLLLCFFTLKINCIEEEHKTDLFVATKEWKVVKKGQHIPKGLHVRINFETGITEAKLLEHDSEQQAKALLAIPQDSLPNEDPIESRVILKSKIAETFHKIKNDDAQTKKQKSKINKFRTYDELKENLKEFNLIPKLDSEILQDLLKKYESIRDKTELLNVLEDLDFLMHQYDNANEFVKRNGFSLIIYKNINSTDVDVKKETLRLMVSIMQNNNGPKIHALETGAIIKLLRLISLDPDIGVKKRALAALGSLLRAFPIAQKTFIKNGGLPVLSKSLTLNDVKLQIKVITMVSDLLTEQKLATNDKNLNKYYKILNFKELILEHEWCHNLNKILQNLVIIDKNDHDSIEKCLIAMKLIKSECRTTFTKTIITKLCNRYTSLSIEDEATDTDSSMFFNSLKIVCLDILQDLNKHVKIEL